MTNLEDETLQHPDSNKGTKEFLNKTGKTIWDVILWVPLHVIEWIGVQPFKWRRILLASIFVILISSLIFVFRFDIRDLIVNKYPELRQLLISSSESKHLKIAYFYVNPNSEEWAAQDGIAQKQGFELAIKEFDEENGPQVTIPRSFIYGTDTYQDVIKEMKNLYKEDNVSIYIVTMSGLVKPLRAMFKAWRDSITDLDKQPVLIATVTSAPDIADIKNGILRFYIRSTEEADNLAKYAYWKLGATDAGVFYISDTYGRWGAITFSNEFKRLGGNAPICCEIMNDPKDSVNVISNWVRNDNKSNSCALIVGYGDMLKRTIEELDNHHYKGTILCVSTITNEMWRPKAVCPHAPLVTVVPERAQLPTPYPPEDYNVVLFFSKLTLLKALDCARNSKTTSEFIEHWQTNTPHPPHNKDLAEENGLSVSYLSDGDVIIKLKVEEIKR